MIHQVTCLGETQVDFVSNMWNVFHSATLALPNLRRDTTDMTVAQAKSAAFSSKLLVVVWTWNSRFPCFAQELNLPCPGPKMIHQCASTSKIYSLVICQTHSQSMCPLYKGKGGSAVEGFHECANQAKCFVDNREIHREQATDPTHQTRAIKQTMTRGTSQIKTS